MTDRDSLAKNNREWIPLIVLVLLLVLASIVIITKGTRTMDVSVVRPSPPAPTALRADRADYYVDGTNDKRVVYAAIDALPAEGGTITFLPGTYDVSLDEMLAYAAAQGKTLEVIYKETRSSSEVKVTTGGPGQPKE